MDAGRKRWWEEPHERTQVQPARTARALTVTSPNNPPTSCVVREGDVLPELAEECCASSGGNPLPMTLSHLLLLGGAILLRRSIRLEKGASEQAGAYGFPVELDTGRGCWRLVRAVNGQREAGQRRPLLLGSLSGGELCVGSV